MNNLPCNSINSQVYKLLRRRNELGIAFAHFSAKPDEDEHKIVCEVASRLELEIPDYDELVVELITGAMHLAGLTQVVINTIYDHFNNQADSSETSPNGV